MSAPFDPAMDALFASTLADSAIHIDSSYQETPTRVIASRAVELVGEYGETAGVIDTIGTKTSAIDARVGDTVAIASGIMAGSWVLHRKLADDGYHRTFEVVAA